MPQEERVASTEPAGGADEADLAQAFQELAKGERAASALENQLSAMEAKIEELLAKAEQEQEEVQGAASRSEVQTSGGQGASEADGSK